MILKPIVIASIDITQELEAVFLRTGPARCSSVQYGRSQNEML